MCSWGGGPYGNGVYGTMEEMGKHSNSTIVPVEVEMESEILAQEEEMNDSYMYVEGEFAKAEAKAMTKVKFIYREQVIQVIEGENSRKGELSVITRDKDVPAHEVEHTVRRIANAGTD